MSNFTAPIPPAPDCPVCGAKPLADHIKGCVHLSVLRTSAYPQVLDDNGLPWYLNTIRSLQDENAMLKVKTEQKDEVSVQPSNNSNNENENE